MTNTNYKQLPKFEIDEDTRFNNELINLIHHCQMKAMTNEEFEDLMQEYDNEYYMTENCEEVYPSKIETREVYYQAEEETLPFDF